MKITNRVGRPVWKYEDKYIIFKCKFCENKGVSGPNIDQNAWSDFFPKNAIESVFPRFILRMVRGYIVHLVFEPQIGEYLLAILHTENTHFDRLVSFAKKITQP